jgi:hypothetical protein
VLSRETPEKMKGGVRLSRRSAEWRDEKLADMAESVGDGDREVAAEVERLLMLMAEGWRRVGPPASGRTEVRIMASEGW